MLERSKNEQSPARIVEIGVDEAGQRLDNFLLARLRGVPRSLVYRIVRSGEVRVNSARPKPQQRLQVGDRVRLPPLRTPERESVPAPGRRLLEALATRVLYEDESLIVIDKPSGLAVHGGSGVSSGLIEALRALRPDCRALELVHRLDRDTSGCIMVAKKRAMLRFLHEALREGRVRKTYVALVEGRWPRRRTRVSAALEKNIVSSGERVVRASEAGKPSETEFAVLRNYVRATLVEARPVTGRTHQIRVHTRHAGHPIAGDEKYGNRDFNRQMRDLGLKRLFLHASAIRLQLPSGRELSVEAPLDPDLESFLARLEV